jgi:hypothetical protein
MVTDMLKAKWFRITICSALGLIVLLLVFLLGAYIGEKKAEFGYRWGQNYGRFFGEPRVGFFNNATGSNMQGPQSPMGINAFGNGGVVLKVDGTTMAIKGNDNIEKVIAIDPQTLIREGNSAISLSDIESGDQVVVIGAPDNTGQILARFIRVFEHHNQPTPTSTNNQ